MLTNNFVKKGHEAQSPLLAYHTSRLQISIPRKRPLNRQKLPEKLTLQSKTQANNQ